MNYETLNSPDEPLPANEEGDVRFHHDEYLHECWQYLEYRTAEWTEPHGECCHDEWWECAVCGTCFSEQELKRLGEAA